MGKEDVVCIPKGLWLRHEKEWNLAICDNMDEPWECYTKWNKSEEKDKYHTNTIWSCMLGSCISHVRLFVTFELFMVLIVHRIIIHGIMNNNPMAPLFMEFPRQESWSGLSFPSPAIWFYSYVLVEPKTKPYETNEQIHRYRENRSEVTRGEGGWHIGEGVKGWRGSILWCQG